MTERDTPAPDRVEMHRQSAGGPEVSDPKDSALLRRIRQSVIGDDRTIAGPYGHKRVTYADYTASGRALTFIEDLVRDQVLPLYANTHSESTATARQTS